MKSYTYKNYTPYSAADLYSMDFYVEEVDGQFNGNVTEQLIIDGAEFEIIDEDHAVLIFKKAKRAWNFVKVEI